MNRLSRIRSQDACEFHRSIGSPPSVSVLSLAPYPRSAFSIASVVKFTETDAENPHEINGTISANFRPRSAPPLNLLGGSSHRFAGGRTAARAPRLRAVLGTELGIAGEPVISADGVVTYAIPRRR